MLFFAAGGEKKMHYDSLQMTDKNGQYHDVTNNINPSDDQFNDTISKFGENINSNRIYNPGIDADMFDVGKNGSGNEIIDNSQSETTLKLCAEADSHQGDQSFPSLIAFSTQLYKPNFCYDYAYSQNGMFFTEPFDINESPRILGHVQKNQDINVSIYIKNKENSDIVAKDVKFDALDINKSQLIYDDKNLTLFSSDTNSYTKISPDEINITESANEENLTQIPFNDMADNAYKYLYFPLQSKTDELNQSMRKWRIRYKLSINGKEFNFTQSTYLKDLPICSNE
jgi:hypothetical protein